MFAPFVKISLEFVDFRADVDRIFTNLVESIKVIRYLRKIVKIKLRDERSNAISKYNQDAHFRN